MKKLIFKFLYLFYKYYDQGSTKRIAYFSAIVALLLAIMLHVFTISIWFGIEPNLGFWTNETPKWKIYLIGIPVVFILYYFLLKLFPKEDTLKITMEKKEMRIGYLLIIAYFLLSFILLIVSFKINYHN